jgi:hypothetical protein
MPEYNNKRKRSESLRRSRNNSVLQIIQTLEICGKEILNESPFAISSMKKHLSSHLLECKGAVIVEPRILLEQICIERDVDNGENFNDDDTFITAKSTIPESLTSKVDTIVFSVDDKPFDIGAVTPIMKTNSRRTTLRSPCTSASYSTSDFCNNDLARQIEAMVLEAEISYENRPKRSRPSAAWYASAEHATIDEVEHSNRANESLVTIKNNEFSTPSRKTIEILEKMKVVTPSPQSRRYAVELFSRMFHAQDSADVPALRPVGSTASLSSEFSFDARYSDDNFSLKRMKLVKNIAARQQNEAWTLF